MTCQAVTRRASEGPCGTCGRVAVPEIHVRWGAGVPHRYLGPVVERCGHEESEHETVAGAPMCYTCVDTYFGEDSRTRTSYPKHAYVEEPEHD